MNPTGGRATQNRRRTVHDLPTRPGPRGPGGAGLKPILFKTVRISVKCVTSWKALGSLEVVGRFPEPLLVHRPVPPFEFCTVLLKGLVELRPRIPAQRVRHILLEARRTTPLRPHARSSAASTCQHMIKPANGSSPPAVSGRTQKGTDSFSCRVDGAVMRYFLTTVRVITDTGNAYEARARLGYWDAQTFLLFQAYPAFP